MVFHLVPLDQRLAHGALKLNLSALLDPMVLQLIHVWKRLLACFVTDIAIEDKTAGFPVSDPILVFEYFFTDVTLKLGVVQLLHGKFVDVLA